MTIYDIPNIEHCTVTAIGTVAHRIVCNDGWYIHKSTDPAGGTEENPTVIYQTVAIVYASEDLSGIEIVAEADLPDNAEICGGDNEPEHEVM